MRRTLALAWLVVSCGPAIASQPAPAERTTNRAPSAAAPAAEPPTSQACVPAEAHERVACGELAAPALGEAELDARLETWVRARPDPATDDAALLAELHAWRCRTGAARWLYWEARLHRDAERLSEAIVLFEAAGAAGDPELAAFAWDLELDTLNRRLPEAPGCAAEMERVLARALAAQCAPALDAERCERWRALQAALAAR